MVQINIQQIQAIENAMLKETIEILNRHNIPFYMCCGSVLGTIRHQGPIPWDTDMDLLIPSHLLEQARDYLEAELSDRFCIDDLKNNKKYKNMFPRVALPHSPSDTLHIDLFPLIGLPDDEKEQHKICDIIMKRQKTFVVHKHMRQNIRHSNFVKNAIGLAIEIFCSPFSKKTLWKQYQKIVMKYPYDGAKFVMNGCGHYGAKNIFEKEVFGTPVWKPYCDMQVPIPEQWDFYLKRYYKDYMSFPPEEERNFWLAFKLDIDERDFEKVKDLL